MDSLIVTMDWKEILVIVFAGMMAGILTPVVMRWLSKKGIFKGNQKKTTVERLKK